MEDESCCCDLTEMMENIMEKFTPFVLSEINCLSKMIPVSNHLFGVKLYSSDTAVETKRSDKDENMIFTYLFFLS